MLFAILVPTGIHFDTSSGSCIQAGCAVEGIQMTGLMDASSSKLPQLCVRVNLCVHSIPDD